MILEREGTNVGTLCKIELVDVKKVASMPDAYQGQIIAGASPTLVGGAAWENIYFTQDTAHFVEATTDAQGAEVQQLLVKWKVPKDRAAAQKYFQEAAAARYVARLTDMNGTQVLAGTPAEGCRILRTMRDKGQNIRDSNHYLVELRLTRSEPAPII